MDEAVMQSHIGLYVNRFSRDLGEEGLQAMRELLRTRGRGRGLSPVAEPDMIGDDAGR
jgi:1,4-dihydroxy-6-naphthoate synthase